MKLADLSFGQRHDGNAGELQILEQRRHIGLVARDAVQRLGQHHVELARLRVLQQRLDAGPQDHARAGDARVLVRADDLPLLALRLLSADAELVVDGRLALIVGGIAGIKGNAGHRPVLSKLHGQRRTAPLFFARASSRKLALILANSPGGMKP